MVDEPTVLDYVKSLLTPWRGSPLKFPSAGPATETDRIEPPQEAEFGLAVEDIPEASAEFKEPIPVPDFQPEEELPRPLRVSGPFPWRSLIVLGLALAAQRAFEPGPNRGWQSGVLLYVLAAGWLLWAIWRSEWLLPPVPESQTRPDSLEYRHFAFIAAVFMAVFGYLIYGGNRFTGFNFTWLLAMVALLMFALWQPDPSSPAWGARLGSFFKRKAWSIQADRWAILVGAALILSAVFRFSRLGQAPPEMTSDHAEKILDIARVLAGQTSIFFPNNGGREALQMYFVAGLHRLFGLNLNFLTLKISTTIIGFLTLPILFLLGKEIGNRRVGLLALVFAGVSYWGNLVSRVGLRLPFYFLFTAATFYFLFRGLRLARRNDFILAGICLGLSMYGYTADRILPLVVLSAVGIYLLHRQSSGQRYRVLWYTGILLLIALMIFIPMLRYMVDQPGSFLLRTLTRMGGAEQPLPGPAWKIFLSNLWRSVTMFSWGDGEVWLASVPYRPALDVVAGALFWLGAVLTLVRYIRSRHWLDLFLLVSIPLLMLPSILSLAFPNENPNLYRSGGALIPVFLLIAGALDGLMAALERWSSAYGNRVAWGIAALLLLWSGTQSYDLVFNQYVRSYQESAWNTSEMAQVVRGFIDSVGSLDTAYLVGYPYWADSRVLGIAAGYPTKDFAIWPDGFQATTNDPRAKLFLLYPQDQADVDALRKLYPQGWLQKYASKVENKDFFIFFVPPR